MAVNSPERLLWLLHQVERPEIRIAYDYSHFELQGIPLKESLAALAPYTVFVHVKDSQGSGKTGRFLLPGEGRIDYVTYFRLLEQFGYRGPVVVEVSSQIFTKPGYDPIKAAEKSYRVLNAALQVM
jgi:inosose dehydratase